ncbi:MAG: aspartate--ammonia ligase [Bacteroidales bacterium]|nr:aspartate--ammonia ligase [Bacteroidales bacterium]
MWSIPSDYKDILGGSEATERAIKAVKDMFQQNLSAQLALLRVTAPMVVLSGQGLNDDLNGVERPVRFPVKSLSDAGAEVVHSLAKWKRLKLAQMGTKPGRGIYTDMNALRPDEDLDNLHSIYVDQWDWEKVIRPEDRSLSYLKSTVRRIYEAIKVTENRLFVEFPQLEPQLPEDIFFITSEDLLRMFPGMSPKERENAITRKHRAVFIIGIGGALSDGSIHDGRAADYDDWSTPNGIISGAACSAAGEGSLAADGSALAAGEGSLAADGSALAAGGEVECQGLNGDILLWNSVLECAFEVSSMGIRVNPEALHHQLSLRGELHKESLYFHRELLAGHLPQTIGGGIGQSRLCMYLLRKAHIGEIQSSIWPADQQAALDAIR